LYERAHIIRYFPPLTGAPLAEPLALTIVTCPAPNLKAIRRRFGIPEPSAEEDADADVDADADAALREAKAARRRRMERVLGVLAAQQPPLDSVVLGAWGCGVFGNEPAEVAAGWRDCPRPPGAVKRP
jgi:uncharacterized protein (TIGR02452 family)